MEATNRERLELGAEQREILTELLESERTQLLIEIRHSEHRSYRQQLRHRLELVEQLLAQIGESRPQPAGAAA